MLRKYDRKIVLEDGTEYYGYGFGANVETICELTFNTSVVGYQEILTNPACTYQMVVMTYPVIGNYGITDEDYETKQPTIGGLIVREYNDQPSNFRYTKTLSEILEENNIPGIEGIDTRKLARSIKTLKCKKAIITSADTKKEDAVNKIKEYKIPRDAVSKVSCKKKWYSRTSNHEYNVVAIDCGMKLNMIRCLNQRKCNVTIVPYNTSYEEIVSLKPDGILIPDGPGKPEDIPDTIEVVKQLKGKYPMFGICLGHGLITLAYGGKVCELELGIRGGNSPVKNLETGKIDSASQGHSFTVDEKSLKHTKLEVTHINVLDKSVEGVECKKDKVFSVQFHPESAPGPQDTAYLFDKFIELMNR